MSLKLETSPYTTIYRTIASLLTEDATLRSVIRSWKLAAGKQNDFQIPAVNEYPSIALTVGSAGMSPFAQQTNEETMIIDIEMAVAGTDMDDLLNLWWAVQHAIKPTREGRRRVIDALKQHPCVMMASINFAESALKHTKYRDGNSMVGVGSVVINMLLKE